MSQEDRLVRVGIAGLGRAGWGIHAETIARLPEMFQIVAVSDPDASRQQEACTRFGCRAYGEYGDLVKDADVELMVVAVPSQLHADYAVAALEADRHVLVEKPLANNLIDVERMIAVAHARGRILTVNQNYRNTPAFLKVREVIASGRLGRIVLIRMVWHYFARRWDWQTLKEFNGGLLNNAGPHFVDRALLLLGDDVEPDVFCHMERTPVYSGDAESHVKIILHAPGKPMIDMELTSVCAYAQDEWLIMGTQGGLTGNGKALRWKYFVPQALPPRPVERTPTPDRSYNREQLPWVEECYEVTTDDAHGNVKTYRDLYGSLKEGKPLAITAESVRRQIAILDQCREQNPDV